MTFDDVKKSLSGLSIAQIAEQALQSFGTPLRSAGEPKPKRDDVIREVYDRMEGHPVAVLPVAPAPPSMDAAAFGAPMASGKTPPPPAPTFGPVIYEGRSRTGRPFRRGGQVFGVGWTKIGELSPAEIALLQASSRFIQIRARG